MHTFRLILFALLTCSIGRVYGQSSGTRPAMIGQGPNSVASYLHYPSGAKAAKKEGAVQFYCEVRPDGVPRHVRLIAEDPRGEFRAAVDKAVHLGRFAPAEVNGKPVSVLMGGTIIFAQGKNGPVILVSLSTADKGKAGSGANYIQPQLVLSYSDLERNTITALRTSSITMVGGGKPAAEVAYDVSANGAMTKSQIIDEHPKGWGDVLKKATESAKFIPALANGKPAAGQLNLPVDFTMMQYPDDLTGSHLHAREE